MKEMQQLLVMDVKGRAPSLLPTSMELALLHALDNDSPYFIPLVKIICRLPPEDIARCRAVSRSFCRLLQSSQFLRAIPITFAGFIFTLEFSRNLHYFSLASRRTFTISRDAKYHSIFSSHDGLLLSTPCGLRLRAENPLTGMAVTLPWLFDPDEFLLCPIVRHAQGPRSHCAVYFVMNHRRAGPSVITYRTDMAGASPRSETEHTWIPINHKSFFPDIHSGTETLRGVYAWEGFLCVLFAQDRVVWTINRQSGENWVSGFLPFDDSPDGELAICRSSEGNVFLTWASLRGLGLWRLERGGDGRPWFKWDRHVCWKVYQTDIPRVQVLHVEGSTVVILRAGSCNVVGYHVETKSVMWEVAIPEMEGDCVCVDEWHPLFPYCPSFY